MVAATGAPGPVRAHGGRVEGYTTSNKSSYTWKTIPIPIPSYLLSVEFSTKIKNVGRRGPSFKFFFFFKFSLRLEDIIEYGALADPGSQQPLVDDEARREAGPRRLPRLITEKPAEAVTVVRGRRGGGAGEARGRPQHGTSAPPEAGETEKSEVRACAPGG